MNQIKATSAFSTDIMSSSEIMPNLEQGHRVENPIVSSGGSLTVGNTYIYNQGILIIHYSFMQFTHSNFATIRSVFLRGANSGFSYNC